MVAKRHHEARPGAQVLAQRDFASREADVTMIGNVRNARDRLGQVLANIDTEPQCHQRLGIVRLILAGLARVEALGLPRDADLCLARAHSIRERADRHIDLDVL